MAFSKFFPRLLHKRSDLEVLMNKPLNVSEVTST